MKESTEETFARLRRIETRHSAYTAGAFAMREAIAGWASRALGQACAAGIRRIEIPEDKQFPEPEAAAYVADLEERCRAYESMRSDIARALDTWKQEEVNDEA